MRLPKPINARDYDMRHFRFPRSIEGYHPVPDSPGWVWLLTGAVCGLIFLILFTVTYGN